MKLDHTVLDFVEDNPREWVVRVEGGWSRQGVFAGDTSRWYYQEEAGRFGWWYLTELPHADNEANGTMRWDLEPLDPPFGSGEPVRVGELTHISLAPPAVQLRVAGLRADPAEAGRLRERGGSQQGITQWASR